MYMCECMQVIGFLLFLVDGDKVNVSKQYKQLNLGQIDTIFKVSHTACNQLILYNDCCEF